MALAAVYHAPMQTLLVLLFVTLACEKPAPEPQPVRAPTRAASNTCTSADDCALSNLRSDSDCCGDPCEASQAYGRDQLAAMTAAASALCATKDVACPQADCDVPRNLVPGCDHGSCVAVELPRRSTCASDADCVLSCYEPGSCCASCNCGAAWHRDDLANADGWRTAQCGGLECPMKKCAAPTTTARCEQGRCVAR